MKFFLLTTFLIISILVNAQRNKVKVGIMGVPLFQSGFGMGTVGYEKFNSKLNASWQLHFNIAGGSIANDVPVTTRKWATIERSFHYASIAKRISYSFSFFTEIGNRTTKPGYISFKPDSILTKTTAFEINPGASLGLQYKFSKRWGMEMQAGPKLIIANNKEHFTNSITRQNFETTFNKIKAGYMFTGSFYFQL